MTLVENAKQNASRHRLLLLTLLVLLLGCITTIESVRRQDLVWGPLHDSSHSFIFFFASLIGYIVIALHTKSAGLRIALVAGACFSVGIAVELVQPFVGRSASFNDIYYNFIGIVSGALVFHAFANPSIQTNRRTLLTLTASLLLVSSLTVPAIGYYTYTKRDGFAPTLLNFENSWQRRLWRAGGGAHASVVDTPSSLSGGSKMIRIDYPKRSYPGLTIKHVYPDWSDYGWLTFTVFSKLHETKSLTLRVNDRSHIHQYHDRFNQRIAIKPGLNSFRIDIEKIRQAPKGRDMSMTEIAELAVFAVKPAAEFSLYFDDFRLEK